MGKLTESINNGKHNTWNTNNGNTISVLLASFYKQQNMCTKNSAFNPFAPKPYEPCSKYIWSALRNYSEHAPKPFGANPRHTLSRDKGFFHEVMYLYKQVLLRLMRYFIKRYFLYNKTQINNSEKMVYHFSN